MQDPWVKMEHDGIEGIAVAKLSSFEKLQKQKGWRLVGEKKETPKKAVEKKEVVKKTVKKAESGDE